MRKRVVAGLLLLLLLCLAGCGKGKEERISESNVVEIKKDGSVKHTMKDEFPSEYYDGELLKDFVMREASEYNKEYGKDAISIKKLDTEDEQVTLVMEYKTSEDYEQFNGYSFYCGTIADAREAGYDFSETELLEAGFEPEKGTTQETPSIGEEQLLGMGSRRILIVDVPQGENLLVETSGKILYINGAEYIKKNIAMIEGDNSMPAYLVYK